MPGLINRRPAGLLGFLGIKNFGRSPTDMASILGPTWDLSSWYLNSAVRYQDITSTMNAAGAIILWTVPATEVWYVTDWDFFASVGAGEACQYGKCIIGTQVATRVSLGQSITLPASSQDRSGWNQPIILQPGESLGVNLLSVTGVIDIYSAMRYVPMLA